jgi:hypothetical protein
MIIWSISFIIAYKDGSIKEIGAVKDEYGYRQLAGTPEELAIVAHLPKFDRFLTSMGLGGNSYLPDNISDYAFRFSAITTNSSLHVIGSSTDSSGGDFSVVDDDAIAYLTNDESFQEVFSNITYNFDEFTGTSILADEDDEIDTITLPFQFKFYDQTYIQGSNIAVSSNGFISFMDDVDDGCCSGIYLPCDGWPTIIAGLWTDLVTEHFDDSCVRYITLGQTPNRRLVITWKASFISDRSIEDNAVFQIKLFEDSNIIEIHYKSVSPGTSGEGEGEDGGGGVNQTVTIGIQNGTGTIATPYINAVHAPTLVHKAIRFTPNGSNYTLIRSGGSPEPSNGDNNCRGGSGG